eukprot:6440930-Prymnesium_polylepis.1
MAFVGCAFGLHRHVELWFARCEQHHVTDRVCQWPPPSLRCSRTFSSLACRTTRAAGSCLSCATASTRPPGRPQP